MSRLAAFLGYLNSRLTIFSSQVTANGLPTFSSVATLAVVVRKGNPQSLDVVYFK